MLEKRTGVGVKMLDVSADMEERMKEFVLNPRVHRLYVHEDIRSLYRHQTSEK